MTDVEYQPTQEELIAELYRRIGTLEQQRMVLLNACWYLHLHEPLSPRADKKLHDAIKQAEA